MPKLPYARPFPLVLTIRLPRLEVAFLLVGATLLSYWLGSIADARLFERRQQAALARYAESKSAMTNEQSTANGSGRLVGRVEVPRIGVTAMVMDSIEPKSLRRSVGLVPGTSWPGSEGNTVVAGHRDLHFRRLREIRVGDAINFTTAAARFEYRVTSTRVVEPDEVSVLGSPNGVDLTLLTCYPFGYIGPAPRRFIAQARRVELGSASPVTALRTDAPKRAKSRARS